MKKNELMALAFLEGGLVMLLETSSPLIVAPILGHSIIIWATMICLSIGALALGYFLGGYLSKKERSESFIVGLFGVNTLLLFLGWLMLSLQNSSGADIATSTFTWTIVGVVLFIPLLLFGASTPLIVAHLHLQYGDNSSVVGKLYSISTMGGILFSLMAGYFFIPEIGISNTLLTAIILTSLFPILFYTRQKQYKLAIPLLVLGITSIFLAQRDFKLPNKDDFKVKYFSESINGQLIVADFEMNDQPNRILFINRMGQTWVKGEKNFNIATRGQSQWPYVNYVTAAADIYPEGSKSLILGLGGGIVPKQLVNYTQHNVDAVELDERIIDISKNYFGLKGSRVKMYADDARRYIKNSKKKYNFILFDIFNGEILPSHGLSLEAFQDVQKILDDNGLIVVNFNGFLSGKEGLPGRSLIRTMQKAGFKVKLFDTSAGDQAEEDRNLLYLAYLKEPSWDSADIHVRLAEGEHKIGEHLIDPSTIDLADAIIIQDDLPVMEYINIYAAKSWRKSYLENFTLKFKKEQGLPLIK